MTDLKKIKSSLEAELKELQSRVERIDDKLSREEDDNWHVIAVESKDDEVLEEVGEVSQEHILKIKLALSRLEAGEYGKCSSCENQIAKERLEVLPYATKCVKCS